MRVHKYICRQSCILRIRRQRDKSSLHKEPSHISRSDCVIKRHLAIARSSPQHLDGFCRLRTSRQCAHSTDGVTSWSFGEATTRDDESCKLNLTVSSWNSARMRTRLPSEWSRRPLTKALTRTRHRQIGQANYGAFDGEGINSTGCSQTERPVSER